MFFTVGLDIARDVDAAKPRAAVVVVGLRPLVILEGGGILLEGGSATGSVCVLRCLKAGSGTVAVSELCSCRGVARGSIQPEGLCLAVGIGIALRMLVVDSCSSPRARVGDDGMWEKVDGGLIPEGLVKP